MLRTAHRIGTLPSVVMQSNI
ncbi:protein of unknown function [Cupriavidus taiwanensis]|uniref:Uncharacterized protein n=1 Tax=Cupriavidus taiwanensis TaxID=164546 RepID=A0A375G1K8_9BURK|nr:hypothetical protein CBM2585_A130571 [Cupriavidus taiwanensis]SOY88289.1 protein of unknown function [Cupriavidus taiwanensis]SOZ05838.1 hypothetical protein CBM2595_A80523 [Cupriavidus taiwanensis]SPC13440.1 hypothetical protein CT19431_60104 [Cupriavidus taiwanensis]SPC15860.1 hypothetical protein CBM2594_A70425 [Cupriavidus taiwanensis]